MKINFINKTKENVSDYKKIIKSVFKNIKDEKYFNIIFVSLDEIHEINKQYRGIDRPTDVITFSLQENQDELFFEAIEELGDVFISLDKARSQALEYGHSVEREVGFLAVHGYLHLLGYDHMNEEDEKIMFTKQEEILNNAGLFRV